ncbi:hypothetical protein D3C78_1830370 [compost metagenome]
MVKLWLLSLMSALVWPLAAPPWSYRVLVTARSPSAVTVKLRVTLPLSSRYSFSSPLTLMPSFTGGCCCSSWTSTRCRLLPAFR